MTPPAETPQDPSSQRRSRDRSSVKVKIAGAWTASPNRLLKDTRLSRDARLLGALLFLHAANRGTAFPSQQDLADELSHTAEVVEPDPVTGEKITRYEYRQVSVRSVQRWLTELKRCGWLDWRQTLKNNAYTLLDPTQRMEEIGDSSDNDALTGATAVSYGATEGSPSDATERSDGTTAVSSQAIPVSHSSFMHEDSWDEDSSPDTQPAPVEAEEAVVGFLRSLGISAAEEFRHLDLAAVQERVALLQRDPDWRPGRIVKSLRDSPPQPARSLPDRTYIDELNAKYGDLFRAGSDVSDLTIDGIPELPAEELLEREMHPTQTQQPTEPAGRASRGRRSRTLP